MSEWIEKYDLLAWISLLHILSIHSLGPLARTTICIEIIESGLAAIRSFRFQKEESTSLCIQWKAVRIVSSSTCRERHDVGSNAGLCENKNMLRESKSYHCRTTQCLRSNNYCESDEVRTNTPRETRPVAQSCARVAERNLLRFSGVMLCSSRNSVERKTISCFYFL